MRISLIFHKVVQRDIYGVVGSIIITLLQIVWRVRQWKNFESQSIIGKDMDKSEVARFLAYPAVFKRIIWLTFALSNQFAFFLHLALSCLIGFYWHLMQFLSFIMCSGFFCFWVRFKLQPLRSIEYLFMEAFWNTAS